MGKSETIQNAPAELEEPVDLRSHDAYINRELSWLSFSRRVLAMAENDDLPLLERVHFAGIVGMLHDEFFMKRMSGLKRQIAKKVKKLSLDGRTPSEEFQACRDELVAQSLLLQETVADRLRPALEETGFPILDYKKLSSDQKKFASSYFERVVEPILTPLAVDAEHPFPFISHGGLNLAVLLPNEAGGRDRFVRIKVPDNRDRWVELPKAGGVVPLEQVIANNLDLMFPDNKPTAVYFFRVTRGASVDRGPQDPLAEESLGPTPGSLVETVSSELKARRFAGVVRLEVDDKIPKRLLRWLCQQLKISKGDIHRSRHALAARDLAQLEIPGREDLRFPAHFPRTHGRLVNLERSSEAVFREIRERDLLLHHPYQNFDDSVLRLLQSAAGDPKVLGIKLTIYRTGTDSPILRALAEAARRGKQVAVLLEITARFDEGPNIRWANYLEKEGCHVAYGVEQLKTHVKLALVIREEDDGIRRYAHLGTGNYNMKTSRLYEDIGLLTCDPKICEDVADLFNSLTGATLHRKYHRLLVAPATMRREFITLIRREAEHSQAGKPSGIQAKMNQLQDPEMIRELYKASRAGVPISLNVRGLCCLKPGVPGLSENIRVFGTVGRFLEHSRIYRFVNGGDPEVYLGSADWMKRNLDRRVETVTPILDPRLSAEVSEILGAYEQDNASVWDCDASGSYTLRTPAPDEPARKAQEILMARAARDEHVEVETFED